MEGAKDSTIVGSLTAFEQKLMETQEIMTTRGKVRLISDQFQCCFALEHFKIAMVMGCFGLTLWALKDICLWGYEI